MDKCRLNNKIIYIFDFYNENKEIDRAHVELLKKASKDGKLICDYCGEKLRFNYGKIIQPYFSHIHDEGKGRCKIFKETLEQKKVKRTFYEKVLKDNIGIYGEINYRFDNGLFIDLFFEFKDGDKLAIDYIDDINKFKRSEKEIYFKENNIRYIKLVDMKLDIFTEVQGNAEFGFLYSFVEYDYKNTVVLDMDKRQVVLFKKASGSKEIDLYNEIFFKKFNLEKIKIKENGISETNFELNKYNYIDAYNKIKSKKKNEKVMQKSDIEEKNKIIKHGYCQLSMFDL